MSGPLDSSATSQLKALETDLAEYLEEAKKGKEFNKNAFIKKIDEELKKLNQNKNIPDDVKSTLHEVTQSIKSISSSKSMDPSEDMEKIQMAKDQIHDIMETGKSGL